MILTPLSFKRSHFNDMEYKLRPGMMSLTWTSMNIDAYISHVQSGLKKLKEFVRNVNDIIDNRIEKNLVIISNALLVNLSEQSSFTVSEFLDMQKSHIKNCSRLISGKNIETENAVEDLIQKVVTYQIESPGEEVAEADVNQLRQHYNSFTYQSLLHSAKTSLNSLKKRIGSQGDISILNFCRPFFDVEVHSMPPCVCLSPSLDEIQECINSSAQAVLSCYKTALDWGYSSIPDELKKNHNFFERMTKDIAIVRVALLLTGCIQGIRNTVTQYLDSFHKVNSFSLLIFCALFSILCLLIIFL